MIDSDFEVVKSPQFLTFCVYAKQLVSLSSIWQGFLFDDNFVGLCVEDNGST